MFIFCRILLINVMYNETLLYGIRTVKSSCVPQLQKPVVSILQLGFHLFLLTSATSQIYNLIVLSTIVQFSHLASCFSIVLLTLIASIDFYRFPYSSPTALLSPLSLNSLQSSSSSQDLSRQSVTIYANINAIMAS